MMRCLAEHEPLDPEYSILKQRLARRMRYEGMVEDGLSTMDLVQVTKVRLDRSTCRAALMRSRHQAHHEPADGTCCVLAPDAGVSACARGVAAHRVPPGACQHPREVWPVRGGPVGEVS